MFKDVIVFVASAFRLRCVNVLFISAVLLLSGMTAVAQTDSIAKTQELDDVVVKASNGTRSRFRAENVDIIGQNQLIRAACCNLGESFTANPSVDVSYSDAATGAKQIKLLGLSGTYVQMLTENIPNLRGASIPYSLGYVPGPWMQSIQVSKGASSVKNGYESTTGQINIEFLKPQGVDGVRGNVYYDTDTKLEANADGSIHLNDKLSTSILLHYENRQMDHDGNGDGFMDMPKQRQYNLMHRWAYVSPFWISQLSMRVLRDERESGMSHHHNMPSDIRHYGVDVRNDRYEFQWKNGFTLNPQKNSSVALMVHGSWHDAKNAFGIRRYDVTHKNGYAQFMFETDISERRNLSVGASINHDSYHDIYDTGMEAFPAPSVFISKTNETTTGVYIQSTYKLGDKFTLMRGWRLDYSSRHGWFFTPRFHLKYTPWEVFTLRASFGRGYRSPQAMAENTPLLASGRTFYIEKDLKQEKAWNGGLSAGLNIPVCGKNLELNAEYYFTTFINQMVINIDGSKGAHTVSFENLDGKSYSHTIQVDATYPFFKGFTATGAFRINDVKTTYDGVLRQRPLTSKYKGLLTLSYKTPLELWHFDVTGQLNGDGELYDHSKYPAYFQLQAQVTRDFRYFSVYVGGENLTNYRIKDPIQNAHNPWSQAFDATQIWGPTTGAMGYIGVRFKFLK